MKSNPVTLLILSSSEVLRRGLHDILQGRSDIVVLGRSAGVTDPEQLVARLRPAVVLIDFLGHDGRAFDTVRAIRAICGSKAIAFSGHKEWLHVASWLDAGGCGYVHSDASENEIISAIKQVASGATYISPSLREPPNGSGAGGVQISAREREVLVLVARGYTGGEIASQLCISQKTVETHRLRITRKLGLHTRAQLVQYALDHDMLRETNVASRN